MILGLEMPRLGGSEGVRSIEKVHITEGTEIKPGSPLLDLRFDLSTVAWQDCPPMSLFRVMARERGWIRKLSAVVGDVGEPGQILALISSDPEEALAGVPSRALRITTAGIIGNLDWFAPGTNA